MKCGLPDREARLAGSADVLLLAAEQPAENLADRIALATAAAQHAAQDAAQRVVPATASAAQDAAEHVAEPPAAGRGLSLRPGARGCGTSLCELLADVCQHDRCQDRQQSLDQIATTGALPGQRGGDRV